MSETNNIRLQFNRADLRKMSRMKKRTGEWHRNQAKAHSNKPHDEFSKEPIEERSNKKIGFLNSRNKSIPTENTPCYVLTETQRKEYMYETNYFLKGNIISCAFWDWHMNNKPEKVESEKLSKKEWKKKLREGVLQSRFEHMQKQIEQMSPEDMLKFKETQEKRKKRVEMLHDKQIDRANRILLNKEFTLLKQERDKQRFIDSEKARLERKNKKDKKWNKLPLNKQRNHINFIDTGWSANGVIAYDIAA